MEAVISRMITVRAASRLPVPMKPQGSGTSWAPRGVVSKMTAARITENASTPLQSPTVSRIMWQLAASARAAANRSARNARLVVQKQAMAKITAQISFTDGFMRCRKLVPGTYSKNFAMVTGPLPGRRPQGPPSAAPPYWPGPLPRGSSAPALQGPSPRQWPGAG